MKDTPRYASLRDYVQVVRTHRIMIVAVTLAFAGGAYWFSSSQERSYVAETPISLDDATRDSDLVGVPKSYLSSAEQRATLAAEDVDTPAMARRVTKALRTKERPKKIRAAVTSGVDARSKLLVIQASWPTSKFAAKIANTYGRETVRKIVADDRRRYASTARTLRRRYRRLKRETKDPFSRAIYLERVARIEALADAARAAQIVRPATAPEDPTSPKPFRDAVLGGILGLVLAFIAAFVRDALDRRVRMAGEIEEEFELPILGQVREGALGKVPLPSEGQNALSPADLEAFRILRSSVELLDDEPRRVVLVTSPLPEEGKSTVATALAAAGANAGQRTLLLESDLRRPTLARRTGLMPSPGLSDVLAGKVDLREALQTVALSPPGGAQNGASPATNDARPSTLDCLTAGSPTPRPAELLRSAPMEQLLDSSTAGYDLVVVDTSPLLPVADTLALLPHAQVALICMRTSSATREEIHATKALLERVPSHVAGLVITGLRPRDAAAYGYYPYAYTYAGESC